jgi:hypothetical protein
MRALFLLALFATPLSSGAQGQPLTIQGGPVQLVVASAPAGADLPPAEDESSRLSYRLRSPQAVKIAVATNCPGQRFSLSVQARNVTSGTAQGAIPLTHNMAPTDLVRDITLPSVLCFFFRCVGTADLRYRSVVRAEDGLGSDDHIVQYTILAQ